MRSFGAAPLHHRPNVPVSFLLCSRFTLPIPSAVVGVGYFLRHVEKHFSSCRRSLTRCVSECAFIVLFPFATWCHYCNLRGTDWFPSTAANRPALCRATNRFSSVFREQWDRSCLDRRSVQRSARYRKLPSTALPVCVWCSVSRVAGQSSDRTRPLVDLPAACLVRECVAPPRGVQSWL